MTSIKRQPAKGFTLIELVITLAILAILLALGLRSYRAWIANTKIRTMTDSIQNGLALAKATAISTNSKTQFLLTTADPVASNMASIGTNISATGSNWVIRRYQSGGTYSSADFIQGHSTAEGSSRTLINSGSAPTGCSFSSNIIFTGIGNISPVPAGNICFNVSSSDGDRPLRITVSPGGAVRMCDPQLSISSTTMGC